jgi:hypothetical protein
MYKADADAESTCGTELGIAQASINSASSGNFLLYGLWTTTGLTANKIYYASTTLGGITPTAPTGAADVVRRIGQTLSTTQLLFNPFWGYKVLY